MNEFIHPYKSRYAAPKPDDDEVIVQYRIQGKKVTCVAKRINTNDGTFGISSWNVELPNGKQERYYGPAAEVGQAMCNYAEAHRCQARSPAPQPRYVSQIPEGIAESPVISMTNLQMKKGST